MQNYWVRCRYGPLTECLNIVWWFLLVKSVVADFRWFVLVFCWTVCWIHILLVGIALIHYKVSEWFFVTQCLTVWWCVESIVMCLVSLSWWFSFWFLHISQKVFSPYCADVCLLVRNEMFALRVKYCYLSRSSFNSICCMLGFPGAIELF